MEYLDDNWLDGVVMVPVRKGDNSFFFKAVEGQPHNVLYMRKGDAEPQAIFDLNAGDPDGSRSTRADISVSPSGRYVGYPIHHAGADAAEIRFFDTKAGRELDEFLPSAYVFVSDWLPDETGFYYTWVDMPTLMGQPTDKQPGVYLHRMGTPVAKDELVYARPWEGQYMASAIVADDGENLLLLDMNIMGSRGAWAVRPLEGDADTPLNWLIEQGYDHRFAYVGSSASELFVITDYQSPNWRLVALDITNPGVQNCARSFPRPTSRSRWRPARTSGTWCYTTAGCT